MQQSWGTQEHKDGNKKSDWVGGEEQEDNGGTFDDKWKHSWNAEERGAEKTPGQNQGSALAQATNEANWYFSLLSVRYGVSLLAC